MPHRRTRRALAAAAATVLLLAGACSGSSDDPAPAADPRQATNEAYLLDIGYERQQARCVSEAVSVDLEELLSGADGARTPTDKPGFEEFEQATKACIEADAELTTTTAPAD